MATATSCARSDQSSRTAPYQTTRLYIATRVATRQSLLPLGRALSEARININVLYLYTPIVHR